MKYTHILWDFNGTILDDVDVGIESVNTLLKKRGLPLIPDADYYRGVFGFPIIKYYERLGFDFSVEPFAELAVEWVDEYMSRVSDASVNKDIVSLIKRGRAEGLGQVLVSATEREMLSNQLLEIGIFDLFDEVFGLDNIHAVNKISAAMAWREKNPSAKAVCVGDTDHDFETAKAIGADCVLLCGGHQSSEYLLGLGCPVVRNCRELEQIIFG